MAAVYTVCIYIYITRHYLYGEAIREALALVYYACYRKGSLHSHLKSCRIKLPLHLSNTSSISPRLGFLYHLYSCDYCETLIAWTNIRKTRTVYRS